MVMRSDIVSYCAHVLDLSVKDAMPNGLQLEGKDNINKLVSAVTASKAIISQAVLTLWSFQRFLFVAESLCRKARRCCNNALNHCYLSYMEIRRSVPKKPFGRSQPRA